MGRLVRARKVREHIFDLQHARATLIARERVDFLRRHAERRCRCECARSRLAGAAAPPIAHLVERIQHGVSLASTSLATPPFQSAFENIDRGVRRQRPQLSPFGERRDEEAAAA